MGKEEGGGLVGGRSQGRVGARAAELAGARDVRRRRRAAGRAGRGRRTSRWPAEAGGRTARRERRRRGARGRGRGSGRARGGGDGLAGTPRGPATARWRGGHMAAPDWPGAAAAMRPSRPDVSGGAGWKKNRVSPEFRRGGVFIGRGS